MEHLRTRLDPIRRGGAIAALAAAGGLVGCGGDSGGSSVIIDEQISFSVSGSMSVLEETLESVAVTTASANGAPVTVRIQSTGDGGAFVVEDGEIVPRDRLDFEAPADENADNVYAVTLVAEASGLTSITRQIQVTVRNDPADDVIKLTTGRKDDFFVFAADLALFGDGEVVLGVPSIDMCDLIGDPLAGVWAVIVDPDAIPGASDREALITDLPVNAITKFISPSSVAEPCSNASASVASGRYVQGAATTELLSVGYRVGPPADGRRRLAGLFRNSAGAGGPDVNLEGLPAPGVLQTTSENIRSLDVVAPLVFVDLDGDALDEVLGSAFADDGAGGAIFEIRVLDGREVRFDVTSFLDADLGDPGRTHVAFPGNDSTLFRRLIVLPGRDFNGDGALDVLSSYSGSVTGAVGDADAASFMVLFGDQVLARGPGEVDFASLTGVERAVVEMTGLRNGTNPDEREIFNIIGTEDLSGDGVPELLFVRDPDSLGALLADVPLSERRSLFILDGAAVRDAPDRVLRAGFDALPLARLEFDRVEEAPFGGLTRIQDASLLGDLDGDGTPEILVTMNIPPVLEEADTFIVSGGAIDPAPGAVTLQSALSGAIAGVRIESSFGGVQKVPDRFNPLSDETLVLSGFFERPDPGPLRLGGLPAYIIPALRVRQAMEQGGEINLSDIGE